MLKAQGSTLTYKIVQMAEMIKFSHTIFALPFALASMFIAARGLPSMRVFVLVLLAMITLRNAAMSFNRFADASIDAQNPRTKTRHIPQGIFSKKFVLSFSLINALLFVIVSSQINSLCFKLSPFALLIVYFYSLTKRFTSLSHLVLGLALGISPIAAWFAVTGTFSTDPFLLGLAVVFWVAGFDMIYAMQDVTFDQQTGLHSLVVRLGIHKALWVSRFFHLLTLAFFLFFGLTLHLGWPYYLSLMLIVGLLIYEHSLVKPTDLSRVNAAFFNANGLISLIFLGGALLSIFA